MGINIRQKGAEGEREVARCLNSIVNAVMKKHNIPPILDRRTGLPIDIIQRNQNQSAVGGGDLSNVFGLSVEVKRQELLAINTWWAQCEAAAARNNELPVLIYRQNGKRVWHVVMYVEIPIYTSNGSFKSMKARCHVEWDAFLQWFYHWVDSKILAGEQIRL